MVLERETRAYESLTKLMRQVDECRGLFDEAGLGYPEPLQRMLGQFNGHGPNGSVPLRPSVRIEPPPAPNRPPGVADGWIWVPMAAVTAQTCVLGILRGADSPVPVKQIKSEVMSKGCSTNDGSVLNIGTRLEEQRTIRREKAGWLLLDQSKAPMLNGQYAWGAEEMFSKHELAARRRDSIVHVLRCFQDGLQRTQLLTQLENCQWFKGPLNKDQLKVDLEELRNAGRVRRGMQRKWIAEQR